MEICADVIAFKGDRLVIIERLSYPKGLALPGGRLEENETLEECARREFREETGLELVIGGQFRTYSSVDRDPRGRKISTVFYGTAYGSMKDEPKKTRVRLCKMSGIKEDDFAFDHYRILEDFRIASGAPGRQQYPPQASVDRY